MMMMIDNNVKIFTCTIISTSVNSVNTSVDWKIHRIAKCIHKVLQYGNIIAMYR